MMRIPLGSTLRVALKAYLSSDHVSPATGKTIPVVISKNGAAFGNPNAGATNATEIGNGWYYVDLNATDTGTLGPLIVRGTEGTIDPAEWFLYVVAATNAGFTALPAAAADAAGGLPISDAGGLDLDTLLGRLDAAVTSRLAPTTAGRTLDVTATGAAGVDWGNVENPTTTLNLSGTSVKTATDVETDTQDIQSRLPAALTGAGNLKADAQVVSDKTGYGLADGAITAAKFDETTAFPLKSADTGSTAVARTGADGDTLDTLSDQLDAIDAKTTNLPSDPADESLIIAATDAIFGRLGAPAGASVSADIAAVKSDTGTLVSRITSTLFAGITSLAEWLGLIAGKQTGNATARTELRSTGAGSGTFDETTDSQEAIRDRGDAAWLTATGFSTLDAAGVRAAVGLASANLDTQLAALPTAAENADAVWEEPIGDHSGTVGSTAEALGAAGAAGDPWATQLPGAYGAGSAGKIVGDNLNATVSSRASQASVDTIDDFVDTEVAAIKAKTDNLPADPADASDVAAAFATVNSNLATIAGYIDTEVAAIKAKTDNLPASPAASSDIPSAASIADAVWDEARSGHAAAGSFGEGVASVQGNVTGSVGSLAAQAKADVNAEADTALADAGVTTIVTGRIDAAISTRAPESGGNLAAVKAKTDSLTFTQAGQVDANVQSINDTPLVGDGDATPWGPA